MERVGLRLVGLILLAGCRLVLDLMALVVLPLLLLKALVMK